MRLVELLVCIAPLGVFSLVASRIASFDLSQAGLAHENAVLSLSRLTAVHSLFASPRPVGGPIRGPLCGCRVHRLAYSSLYCVPGLLFSACTQVRVLISVSDVLR